MRCVWIAGGRAGVVDPRKEETEETEESEETDEIRYTFRMHERPYEKLIVWQESYKLCLFVYKLTIKFPPHERFGLVSQMRRSSYSVPINIAEGNSKKSTKEKERFFEIAHASLEELHCESHLSKDLGYISALEYEAMDDHIQRVSYLLTKLRSSLG